MSEETTTENTITDHLWERETRIAKVHKLRVMWVIPYAQSFSKTHAITKIIEIGEQWWLKEAEELMESWAEQKFSTAGRLMSFRTHGKLAFGKIRDDAGDLQLCFVRGKCKLHTGKEIVESLQLETDEEGTMDAYKFVDKFIDVGDFIGAKWELFLTKHGELTLFVDEFQLLSKAIRPLPEKFHGIQDQEEIYRKRYLDLIMNQDSYKRFQFKSDFYKVLRDFYTTQWFVEIQTNILWNSASWAAAKPFITHHNDYDTDVYLRIAFETGLKKATVGRYEKIFEIWQDFRNEWSDPSHLQEFTQVEHYAVYRNYEDNMKFTEKMLDYVFDTMQIPRIIKVKDKEGVEKDVNFQTPFERIDFIQWVNQASGLEITTYGTDDAEKLNKDIKAKGIMFDGMDKMGTTTLIDNLYKKVLRPKIIWPAFIYNYPVIMQPLARTSDANANIVEQFQLIVNGREICKAYSELVDPLLQQQNFDAQAEASAKGDEEATSGDDDFVTAMEYGMPPQSGFGMGLERILAILTQQDNLRDVVLFPLMKPKIKE